MLYERWRRVLDERRDTTAVFHVATGEAVSFADLQCRAEGERLRAGEWLRVSAAEGLVALLVGAIRVWRDGAVLMPLDGASGSAALPGESQPTHICHVKLTSGSTGAPRMIFFREEQLLADFDNIRHSMRLAVSSPNLTVISTAHSYGFSNIVLPLLLMGMPAWVVETPLPESVRRAFVLARKEETRLTLPAVPAMWRAWHQADVLLDAPVALAISAGAPLPVELEQAIYRDTGLKVHNFYGASECGGIAYDESELPREDGAFIGRVMHRVSLSVDDAGCLRVKSPAVAEFCSSSDAGVGGGFFLTTDLAQISDDGVRLTGRASDVMNVAGRKISPVEIEAALLRSEQVRCCVVFGVSSADVARVDDIVACVNAAPGVDQATLAARLAAILPATHQPRHWWLTEQLSTDERGKTSRAGWRERFLQTFSKIRVNPSPGQVSGVSQAG